MMPGAALWFMLPSVLTRNAGDWMAASLIRGGRWEAGATLMDRADQKDFERVWRLFKACPQDSTIALCEAAITVRTLFPLTQDERRQHL